MQWIKKPDYIADINDIISEYTRSEAEVVADCQQAAQFCLDYTDEIRQQAITLTENTRAAELGRSGVASLVQHYDLSTDEGVVLMCVAEALLRIPDAKTEKLLISDKLSGADWQKHLGVSESSFVNMSTWGLAVSGKLLSSDESTNRFHAIWKKMLKKSSEGLIRQAVRRAIKMMSEEFVLGRSIEEAIKRGKSFKKQGYTFSFDMLGEAAKTQADAEKYFRSYAEAIEKLAKYIDSQDDIFQRPGISVKLSALYPRYEFSHQGKAIVELAKSLKQLALRARDLNIALTVDAEESDRLDMSLQVFKRVFDDPEFQQWEGLGLAVQAYQKRALPVVDWLIQLARLSGKRVQIRLVKGAYWDTEIKQAQMQGWSGYPVFTRKVSTDVSYLACAKRLLDNLDVLFAKFATHNAYSVAAILTLMQQNQSTDGVEFQNLQGMGKSLHAQILQMGIPCRVYAPVGSHEDLLPYLVRRLLENGANSSFVNQLADQSLQIEDFVQNPLHLLQKVDSIANDKIPLPAQIFAGRVNSAGLNLTDFAVLQALQEEVEPLMSVAYQAAPMHRWQQKCERVQTVTNPAHPHDIVGEVQYASIEQVEEAMQVATQAFVDWNARPVEERAGILEHIADALEANQAELITLLIREAGKIVMDAVDEIREAVDFCRYYAMQARSIMQTQSLTGYTGESDTLSLSGRGVFVCVSPWNFPVAIFVGQIVAALVTGNTVVAKPAEQTSLLAAKVVEYCYHAGVPMAVLQLLPGLGETVGASLIAHPAVAGVMFTGSTQTAKLIHRQLAEKDGPIVPLIAETGGLNVMVADSTALTEQLVTDVIASAFGAAGQRCSALRVLFIQEEVADKTIEMLIGTMKELIVGEPQWMSTDIGPVIDQAALELLQAHQRFLSEHAKLLYQVPLPKVLSGTFCAPQVYEIEDVSLLKQEVFGPILHLCRFKRRDLDQLMDQINALGYGLTFGVHSRIDTTIELVTKKINAGNVYVNRNMVGAVVGLQPFGGCGLSGTGPKAGGPHYLTRLCNEKTVSTDTTAAGGNASLMAIDG